MTAGGIFPAIFGTVALVILMVVALFRSASAPRSTCTSTRGPIARSRGSVRFSVNNLAGVPSIVFGLFGLGFFIQFLGPQHGPRDGARRGMGPARR